MSSEQRLQKLRGIMRDAGLDIVALIPGANLRYLTGGVHYVMERPIVMIIPLDGTPISVIPKLEIPLFQRHSIESHIISWADSEGYEGAFKAAFDMLDPAGKTIGVEGLLMRFTEGEVLRRYGVGATVVDANEQFAQLRLRKDADEILAMRKAIEISQQALEQTFQVVRVGMSEIELGTILEANMKALGGEELSFKTILHGGGNTALPHSGPLAYRVQAGDALLFDFGAVYGGYHADITRTVFLGEPGQEFRDFYNVVKAANAQARSVSKPGIPAEAVDIAAREVLIDAGYEHLIRTRTGHGIGLETHEPPYIVQGNKQVLEPGMMFTIEPGLYQMNRIGVRIEDDMLITEDGAESMTQFERDIIVLEPK